MSISLKERVVEIADILREVIHDATAPLDDELRRGARRLLALWAAIPGTVIAFTCLIWFLFLSGCAAAAPLQSQEPAGPVHNDCPLGSVPEEWPCRVKY